jgi:hypothetical protein
MENKIKACNFLVGNMKGRAHWEDLDIKRI